VGKPRKSCRSCVQELAVDIDREENYNGEGLYIYPKALAKLEVNEAHNPVSP
jgi:hypothetical protein